MVMTVASDNQIRKFHSVESCRCQTVPHCSFFLNLWPQLGVQDLFLQSLLIKSFDWAEKNYKNWKLQKDWKLQETFFLPPKAKNAAFAAAADSTCLGAMKWSWVSEMDLLSVIINQSVMSAKRSLLISFCKMFFLVLLYHLHLLFHWLYWKKYFFPIPEVSQRQSK